MAQNLEKKKIHIPFSHKLIWIQKVLRSKKVRFFFFVVLAVFGFFIGNKHTQQHTHPDSLSLSLVSPRSSFALLALLSLSSTLLFSCEFWCFESFDGALPERSLMRVSRGNLLALSALTLVSGFGCLLLLSPI